MKISKVKQLLEILETCNPDAEVYMTSGTGEITDIIAVDQPASDIVIVKSDDHIYINDAPPLTRKQSMINQRIQINKAMKRMQMNTKLASIIIDRIHEENLPITISTGEKLDDEMIDVLVESDEEGLFSRLLNETINNNLLNFTEQ